MIPIKSAEEIEVMQQGGRKLAWVFKQLKIEPGMSLKEIDYLIERLIKKQKGRPSFKMVEGYYWASCLNVNQGVVHGVPADYQLKAGDILSIDIGMFYQGFHTDKAETIRVGRKDQSERFLIAGRKALAKAVDAALPGNRVGHISQAMEKEIKKHGFQPIRALVGHGVGRKLHESPQIPCFLKGEIAATEKLKPGMVLAIEVIYTKGKYEMVVNDDGWTVETADGQLAGLFEDTVAVTKRGPLNLTQS